MAVQFKEKEAENAHLKTIIYWRYWTHGWLV